MDLWRMCSEYSPEYGQELWHSKVISESSARGCQEGCAEDLDLKIMIARKSQGRHLSVGHFCYRKLYRLYVRCGRPEAELTLHLVNSTVV
jgi:hypothetical protein